MSEVQRETSVERKARKRKLEEDLAAINAAEAEEIKKATRLAIFEQMPEKYRPFFADAWTNDDDAFQTAENEVERVLQVLQQMWNARKEDKVANSRKTGGSALHQM